MPVQISVCPIHVRVPAKVHAPSQPYFNYINLCVSSLFIIFRLYEGSGGQSSTSHHEIPVSMTGQSAVRTLSMITRVALG